LSNVRKLLWVGHTRLAQDASQIGDFQYLRVDILNSNTTQDKEAEIEFFQGFGRTGYEAFTAAGYLKLLAEYECQTTPLSGKHVIDFGCGTGAFTARIRQDGMTVTGVDITLGCLARARKEHPGIAWVVSDIEQTGLQASCADIVVLSGVMHHFRNLRRVIREAHRVLKVGGKVFAYDPNKRNPAMWLFRDEKSPIRSLRGITRNERLLDPGEVRTELEAGGFRGINVYAISGIGFKHIEGKLTQLGLPMYNVWDYLLSKVPCSRHFGSFIITSAEK